MEKVASKKKALARAKQLMVMEKSDASLEFAMWVSPLMLVRAA
jgi:hypothetical protein